MLCKLFKRGLAGAWMVSTGLCSVFKYSCAVPIYLAVGLHATQLTEDDRALFDAVDGSRRATTRDQE